MDYKGDYTYSTSYGSRWSARIAVKGVLRAQDAQKCRDKLPYYREMEYWP